MSITNERLHELARTADLDPFEVRALIAEVLTLREQRDKAWPGVITTATFSRGDVYRDADCDRDIIAGKTIKKILHFRA